MPATVIEITHWARPHLGRRIHRVRGRVRIDTQLRRQGLIRGKGRALQRLKPFVVTTDGRHFLLQQDWRRCLRDGEVLLVIASPPAGGGGGSRIFSMLALVALSLWTGGLAAGAWGGAVGTALGVGSQVGAGLVQGAVGMAINVAGNMLLNAVLPATRAPAGQNRDSSSPNYSVSAQGNLARLMEAVPVLYGHFRIYPDYAAQPYTDYRGQDQYLYQLFLITQGELDIEQIRIGATPVTSFSEVQYQIVPPGGQVTLFPDNVVTADAVAGSQIDIPSQGGDWVGPFVTNPAETQTHQLGIDVAWPAGLYRYDTKGRKQTTDSPWTAQAQPIDVSGNPLGDWFDLIADGKWSDSERPLYESYNFPVPAGRYQVRLRRLEPTQTSGHAEHTMTWQSLKAYLPSQAEYGDCTLLAMVTKAGAQINAQTSRKVNVIGTRRLPIWNGRSWSTPQLTRNPAWALADVFRNASYGRGWADNRLNLEGLLTLARRWDERGDSFDGVFDTKITLWEAATRIARAGRAMPMYFAGVVEVLRDEPRAVPTLLLGPPHILQGSLKIDYSFPSYDSPDHVVVEYTNPNTWEPQTVACAMAGSAQQRPKTVQLHGVISREQAFREGMYMIACHRDQRKFVTVQVEMEGYIPRYGDRIDISHDTPAWGLSGTIVDYQPETGTLTTSEPLAWYPGQSHYVALRARDGSAQGPYRVSQGEGLHQMRLQGLSEAQQQALWISDGLQAEPSFYQFGPGNQQAQPCLLLRATPQGQDQVELYLVNYAPSVYLAETDASMPAPDSPSLLTPVSGAPVVGSIGLVQNPGSHTVHLSVDPVPGAIAYEFQISYDGGLTWQIVGLSASHSLEVELPPGEWLVRARAIGGSGDAGPWNQNPVSPSGETWPLGTVKDLQASRQLEQRILLSWSSPEPVAVANAAAIEIWVADRDQRSAATRVGQFAIGTSTYQDSGLGLGVKRYYWVRLAGKDGGFGEDVGPAEGRTSDSIPQLIESLSGQITGSQLAQDLLGHIDQAASQASQALQDAAQAAQAAQANADALSGQAEGISRLQESSEGLHQSLTQINTTVDQHSTGLTLLQQGSAEQAQQLVTLKASVEGHEGQLVELTSVTSELSTHYLSLDTTVHGQATRLEQLQTTSAEQASSLQRLSYRSGARPNLLKDLGFQDPAVWSLDGLQAVSTTDQGWGRRVLAELADGETRTYGARQSLDLADAAGRVFTLSADFMLTAAGGEAYATLLFFNAEGEQIGFADSERRLSPAVDFDVSGERRFDQGYVTATAPPGTMRIGAHFTFMEIRGPGRCGVRQPKLEQGEAPSLLTDEQAGVQIQAVASALASTYAIRTELTQDGQVYAAGMSLGVTAAEGQVQSQFLVLADQFALLSGKEGGTTYSPFFVKDGAAYIRAAFIENASISNAQIIDGAITNAKISGTFASDNGNAMINWETGQAMFRDVRVSGEVTAQSLSGKLQQQAVVSIPNLGMDGKFGGVTPNFFLPPPVRNGNYHTPLLQLTLYLGNGGSSSSSPVSGIGINLEKSYDGGGNWGAFWGYYYRLSPALISTQSVNVADTAVNIGVLYRIRVTTGNSQLASLSGVAGLVTGIV